MTEFEQLKYPTLDLKTSLVFPLYLCSKELTRRYNQVLKEYDITYTQYLVLMYFFKEKTSNLKRIGDVMLLDSSTLTPLLNKLEKKGIITKKKQVKDERNLVITLTEKGQSLENKLQIIPKQMKKEIGNLPEKNSERNDSKDDSKSHKQNRGLDPKNTRNV